MADAPVQGRSFARPAEHDAVDAVREDGIQELVRLPARRSAHSADQLGDIGRPTLVGVGETRTRRCDFGPWQAARDDV